MTSQLMANVFLICFLVGMVLTLFSVLLGFGHDMVGVDMHHDFGGDSHSGDAGSSGGPGMIGHLLHFFNYNAIVMFLTWFGGVGYLLTQNSSAGKLITMVAAVGAGFVGAGIVYVFLNKFVAKGQTELRPIDYYLPGTLGHVTSTIREGGTGEIMYVQGGTRKTAGARAEDGSAYKQGEEVVIVRYDKGIAYVKSVAEEFGAE